MGGAGTVSSTQCIHFIHTKRDSLSNFLSLALFLYVSLFYTLSLLSSPSLLPLLYLHYGTVMQRDIICIKHCHQLNEQLSYSLIYLEEVSESFGAPPPNTNLLSPTTSVTFVSKLLASFVIPPQITQLYFWKT